MDVFGTLVPTVERRWLFLAAAVLWGIAGLILCGRAYGWLAQEDPPHAVSLVLAGLAAGVVINRFKFSHVARKNIKRIARLNDRENMFAFQSVSSYVLIAFMMGLGIALRHSALPRPILAVMYLGIGIGLLLSSLSYYPYVLQPETAVVS